MGGRKSSKKRGKERELGVEVTIAFRKVGRYETGATCHARSGWWKDLADLARRGEFDEELFRDMAYFAFDDFLAQAKRDVISRELAHLAFAMKEFADLDVEISPKFRAAQMLSEALYMQGCCGWQEIDGKFSEDKIVVIGHDGEEVEVCMDPIDLAPLM